MNIRYTMCGHEVPHDQVSNSSFKFQAEPHFPLSLMKSSVTIVKSSLEVSDHDSIQVHCDNAGCIFSPAHGTSCTPGNCARTCFQRCIHSPARNCVIWLMIHVPSFQYPEQFSEQPTHTLGITGCTNPYRPAPHVSTLCPKCSQSG